MSPLPPTPPSTTTSSLMPACTVPRGLGRALTLAAGFDGIGGRGERNGPRGVVRPTQADETAGSATRAGLVRQTRTPEPDATHRPACGRGRDRRGPGGGRKGRGGQGGRRGAPR